MSSSDYMSQVANESPFSAVGNSISQWVQAQSSASYQVAERIYNFVKANPIYTVGCVISMARFTNLCLLQGRVALFEMLSTAVIPLVVNELFHGRRGLIASRQERGFASLANLLHVFAAIYSLQSFSKPFSSFDVTLHPALFIWSAIQYNFRNS